MTGKVRLWDFVLIFGLIALSLAVYFLPARAGQTVEISVSGSVVATLPLNKDTRYALPDGMGTVVVEHGTVRLEDPSCPDRLCEKTGKIERQGQTVLCLPNRICLKISGQEVDAVVG